MKSKLRSPRFLVAAIVSLGIAGCSHSDRLPSTGPLPAAPAPQESNPGASPARGAHDISQWRYMITTEGSALTIGLDSQGAIIGRLVAPPDASQKGGATLELNPTTPSGVVLHDVPASSPNEKAATQKRPRRS